MSRARAQGGVMLIEALVGILIFSIGILALIGMQGRAMKSTADARYYSEASYLASEVIGRMWTDIGNLANYDKDSATAYPPRDDWVAKVSGMLPGIPAPAPAPTIEVGASNEVTVTIEWRQPGETVNRRLQLMNRVNAASAP